MKRLLVVVLLLLASVLSAQAQEKRAFDLGFELGRSLNILAVCQDTVSQATAVIAALQGKRPATPELRDRLFGLESLMEVGIDSANGRASMLEALAIQLLGTKEINTSEYSRVIGAVKQLRQVAQEQVALLPKVSALSPPRSK